MPGESLVFDRAADYYDKTRTLSPEVMERLVPMLSAEAKAPVIEIGVGTGRIALPLADAGAQIFGIDLSIPMLEKLVAKDRSRQVPIAIADARRLPFPTDTFVTGIAAHVFHLIEDWRDALDEMHRVLRPSGHLLVNMGGDGQGPWDEIHRKMRKLLGERANRPGASRIEEIDAALADRATSVRTLPVLIDRSYIQPGAFIDRLERGWYSFTWGLEEEVLREASAHLRRWAEETYGPLDKEIRNEYEVVWRVYELP